MPVENIKVPDLGGSEGVEVVEILVSEGQTVEENDSLIVLESDKAAMEIPSPRSGVVKSISIKVGDELSEGDEILKMDVEGEASQETEEQAGKGESGEEESGKEEPAEPEEDSAPASGREKEETADSSAGGETRSETVEVPDIGGETDVEIIEVHVAPGDLIEAEDSLITLESDKAAMDIPAPRGGEVESLLVKVGDKVSSGSPILKLLSSEGGGEQASGQADAGKAEAADKQEEADKADRKEAPAEPEKPAATGSDQPDKAGDKTEKEAELQRKQEQYAEEAARAAEGKVYAGPAVRKLARELGVDLTQVEGTGARGRIQKEDVQEFVKSRMQGPPTAAASSGAGIPPVPDVDFSQFGEIEEVPLSKLQKVTAANMHRNWLNVPAVAQFNEADITDLETFRKEQKPVAEKKQVKLTLLPFLLKACARALEEYPQFNVSLHSSGETMIRKKYIHIGVAVATEAGLVVPVVRDVDQKSVWQLAAELGTLTDKARNRRLSKDEMQGACFTISSLGAIGGTGFTPIVNSPEVAILGVSKTSTKPVYQDGEFLPRQMMPFSLCYDHRAVNGADAGMFATYLADVLSDIRLLMM